MIMTQHLIKDQPTTRIFSLPDPIIKPSSPASLPNPSTASLAGTAASKMATEQRSNVVVDDGVAAAAAFTEQQQQELPTPVMYLRSLFEQTENGKLVLLLAQKSQYTFQKPTQKAIDSYDREIVNAIRNKDLEKLRTWLHQQQQTKDGRTFDACNRFGESLLHMACRRGDLDVVRFLIYEAKVNVAVRDDFGRSAVHDTLWTKTPNTRVLDVLLGQISPDLLLAEDVRGNSPFHYARKEHWVQWVQFLHERRELISRRLQLVNVVTDTAGGQQQEPNERLLREKEEKKQLV